MLLAHSLRELDAKLSAALDEHVRSCAACASFAAAQKSVNEALDLWEPAPVSADFDRRLYRRIEREVPWRGSLARLFRPDGGARWLPVAAAAGLLMAVGLWIGQPGALPPPDSRSAQIEALPPEQAEHALQEMEIMQEFSRLDHPEPAEPRM